MVYKEQLNELSTNRIIAATLISEGCNLTNEGSYSWTYKEIANMFAISLEYVMNHSQDIVNEMNKFNQVAGTDRDSNSILVYFYLNYCGLNEEGECS